MGRTVCNNVAIATAPDSDRIRWPRGMTGSAGAGSAPLAGVAGPLAGFAATSGAGTLGGVAAAATMLVTGTCTTCLQPGQGRRTPALSSGALRTFLQPGQLKRIMGGSSVEPSGERGTSVISACANRHRNVPIFVR